jgi:prepilin-type N-terminal cleavage/methylation domain-containing protein
MQAHTVLPSHITTARHERGFSLVEVIIAMSILSIVLGGAALAVVSSDSVETKTKAVADSHAMAEKAVERLRTDLSYQNYCDQTLWIQDAATAKQSGSTSPASFRECTRQYTDMTDAKGRQYIIDLAIQAKDRPDDGYGANDADNDLRDAYDVEATVKLAPNSKAGRENVPDISVGASVDWETGNSDKAEITLVACGIDRPDRALIAGGCNGSDASRVSLPSVSINAYKVDEDSGAQTYAGNISASGSGMLLPGAYKFTAAGAPAGFTLLKLDPENLRVYGSQKYTVQATFVRSAIQVQICTQVENWDTKPVDDGYEVTRSNVHWRRTNQPGYRSQQVTIGQASNPRQWACNWVMYDPVESKPGSPKNLYKGIYDLEVEQNALGTYSVRLPYVYRWGKPAHPYSMYVTEAMMNCKNPLPGQDNAYSSNLYGGTDLYAPSGGFRRTSPDPVNERSNGPVPSGEPNNTNRNSFYARMPINTNTARLCLRFHSRSIDRIRCYQKNGGGVYKWTVDGDYKLKGCFYVKTVCSLKLPKGTSDNDNNCWNGADICATCGAGVQMGDEVCCSSSHQAGGVSGGPVDTTVACTPNAAPWYNWTGTGMYGIGPSAMIPKSTLEAQNWVGGGSAYYAGSWKGRTSAQGGHPYGVHPDYNKYNLPDNPIYRCHMTYFSLTSDLFKGNGGPFRYYQCVKVVANGRTKYPIYGRVLDTTGSPGNIFYTTVGGALGLAPDSPKMQNYWNPYGNWQQVITGSIAWPNYKVTPVENMPNCGDPIIHIDPTIEEIWETVYDEPNYTQPPGPNLTNLSTDAIGV